MSDPKMESFTPIAITGISALFPSSENSRQFWRNIIEGNDLVSEVPPDHWLADDYCDPENKLRILSNRGGFLPYVSFDPMAFGTPPNTMETIDTAQLLALLVVQRLFAETAALKEERIDKDKISVILGVAGGTELIGEMASKIQRPVWVDAMRANGLEESKVQKIADRIENSYQDWSESTFPGLLGNVVAGRIANRFNLGGTNCVVDAACASSLGAVAMAIHELQSGYADLVITGGVDALNDPFMYMCFSRTPAMSRSGDCRPFSSKADGTLLGEGLGIFALRRLEDAKRDGETIYAVIRGMGTSSDGRVRSIYGPNPEGQAKALRRAYGIAGYGPDEVELVEAHGTATPAGDLAEFQGLGLVFDQNGGPRGRCALGSVKSQIGHTKSAAGAAALIKVALSLHHKILPPTIKVDAPNPALNIDDSPFYLNTRARPWIHTPRTTRKASTSSFGFGGSNFHFTLEEYTGKNSDRIHHSPKELYLFSANDLPELQTAVKNLNCTAERFLPGARQSQMSFSVDAELRLAVMASDAGELNQYLEKALKQLTDSGTIEGLHDVYYGTTKFEGKVALLFPGQGSQYIDMGADLAMEFDAARKIWDRAASMAMDGQYLQHVVFPAPGFVAAVHMADNRRLNQTQWTQPAIGTCSAASLEILNALGLKADAMAGHSYGELTALYAAGAIPSFDALLQLSRQRGEAMAAAASIPGAMTAVFCSETDLADKVNIGEMGLYVANLNSPVQTVIAGPEEAIAGLEKTLGPLKTGFRRLAVSTAFHTPLIADATEDFNNALKETRFKKPDATVYSNMTAKAYGKTAASIRKRLADQLLSPVRFEEMLNTMYADGIRLFIEPGPGNVLSRLVADILGDKKYDVLAFDQRGANGVERFWNGVARLSALGIRLDLQTLWADYQPDSVPEAGSRASVMINGGNFGRPYPPKEGAPGRRTPNPEQVVREENSARIAAAEPSDQVSRTVDPAWTSAIETLQKNTYEAQRLFQETLTHAHLSYLNTSEALLGKYVNPGATQVPSGSDWALPEMPPAPAPAGPAESASAEVPVAAGTDFQASAGAVAQSLDIRAIILKVVAEKTGYPEEMLDLDAQMEAELGIDSIKRVEILAALQEQLSQLADADTTQLAALNTLGEILAHAQSLADRAVGAQTASPEAQRKETGPRAPLQESAGAVAPSLDIRAIILKVVAEKTGYPEEMLDLDAQMEAELGIDSIKRVEILAALQEQLSQLADADTTQLAAMNTLGEILAHAQSLADRAVGAQSASPEAQRMGTGPRALAIRSVEATPSAPSGISSSAFWSGTVSILDDAHGFAQALSGELEKRGVAVEIVGTVPADCTNLIFPPSWDTDPESCDQFALQRFQALRACSASISKAKGHLLVLMNGSGTFCPDNPWTAGILALARTAAREWPDATVKVMDLDFAGQSKRALAAAVTHELCYGGPELEVGLKADGSRYTIMDQPITLPDITPLSPEDVIVVSGGARGITAECMTTLARAAAFNIAIFGRSPMQEASDVLDRGDDTAVKRALMEEAKAAGRTLTPVALNRRFKKLKAGREVKANLARLEALGCRVKYFQVDVVDADSVQAACREVRREFGPITGMVHAAGVLGDKLIQDKTDEQFKMVYDTKVKGLRNLLEACADDPLKRICCFSSVAARSGNIGQSDYAMANETLNKVCRRLRIDRPDCRVVSIQWGPWEGGMVTPELARYFKDRGVPLIPLKDGAACFAKLFTQAPAAPCEVVVGPSLPAETSRRHSWDILIDQQNTPELADHRIQGTAVVPVVMASNWCRRIAAALHPARHIAAVRSLKVVKSLRLPGFGSEETRLRIDCEETGDARLDFKIFSSEKQLHYQMQIELADEPPAGERMTGCEGVPWPWSEGEVYADGKLFHGPRFQVIKKMNRINDHGGCGLLTNPDGGMDTLDGGLQLALLWRLHQDGRLSLPLGFDALEFHQPFAGKPVVHCELNVTDSDANRTIWNVHYGDENGAAIASLRGLQMFVVPSNRI